MTAHITQDDKNAILTHQKHLESRIAKLEAEGKKSSLKALTDDMGAVALILGLILTLASLYDVFIAKPKADRISAISHFNEAVNSVAKLRQDIVEKQAQQKDMQTRLAISSAITPQILNNLTTARALLPEVEEADVGISQLMVLTSEALFIGDMDSAKKFVTLSMSKTDGTPYLRSEAKRYAAHYFFLNQQPAEARQAYESALGELPQSAAGRAYILSDWMLFEWSGRDCKVASDLLRRFSEELRKPGVSTEAQAEMAATARQQIMQQGSQRCPIPPDIDSQLLGGTN